MPLVGQNLDPPTAIEAILRHDACEQEMIMASFRGNDLALGIFSDAYKEDDNEKIKDHILNSSIKNKAGIDELATRLEGLVMNSEQENVKKRLICEAAKFLHEAYLDDRSQLSGKQDLQTYYSEAQILMNSNKPTEKPQVSSSQTAQSTAKKQDNFSASGDLDRSDEETTQDVQNVIRRERNRSNGFFLTTLFWLILLSFLIYRFRGQILKAIDERLEQKIGSRLTRELDNVRQELDQLKREVAANKSSAGGPTSSEFTRNPQSNSGRTPGLSDNRNYHTSNRPDPFALPDTTKPQPHSGPEDRRKTETLASPAVEKHTAPVRGQKYGYPPDTEGEFFEAKNVSDQFQPAETPYLIEIHSDTEASFKLVDDYDTLIRAFQYPGSFLTACQLLKKSGQLTNPGSIVMTPGKLQKEGNDWRVTKKIIISDWS